MNRHKTVFDVEYGREDKAHLAKELDIKEDTKMLLRTFNTEIFEPWKSEISLITDTEIKDLLDRTQNERQRLKRRGIQVWLSPKVLACVASFVLVCTLAVLFMNGQGTNTGTGNGNGAPSNAGEFRGAPGGESTALGTLRAEVEKNLEPLAYLVDVQGSVEIRRGQKTITELASCEVLYVGDILALKSAAKVKVMYEDSFFDVAGPGEYQIALPTPLKIEANNMRGIVEPSFTTRGAGYANPVKTIALAPKTLIAQIVAPVTRAGDDAIAVYSPKGVLYGNTPNIHIGGDSAATYTVAVLNLTGETVGKPIQLKGNTSVAWSALSPTPLETDEIYSLKVTQNGKIVNDANNANFWLLSDEERQYLADNLKRFDKIENQEARDFFKANALYMSGCYTEARPIAVKLWQQHKDNNLYANLVKLCDKALK